MANKELSENLEVIDDGKKLKVTKTFEHEDIINKEDLEAEKARAEEVLAGLNKQLAEFEK